MSVTVNIAKAKNIAHEKRRELRSAEFAPLDFAIAAQIPNVDVTAIEAERQKIRDKYSAMQSAIESASTPEAIKQALGV